MARRGLPLGLFRTHFGNGNANIFSRTFFRILLHNECLGHAQPITAGYNYYRVWGPTTLNRTNFHIPIFSFLLGLLTMRMVLASLGFARLSRSLYNDLTIYCHGVSQKKHVWIISPSPPHARPPSQILCYGLLAISDLRRRRMAMGHPTQVGGNQMTTKFLSTKLVCFSLSSLC